MKNPAKARMHDVQENATYRSHFQRDRDRVLYSSAFRRLSGVTQVAAVNEQQVLHNRLTHSLKVAQLGRSIVQYLEHEAKKNDSELFIRSCLNATVVETAGLMHDIGHPPFGHATEEVLNERLCAVPDLDGFEGNPQSFRIVTKLARRREDHPGLNLTRATLDAMLKYPRPRSAPWSEKDTKNDWTDRAVGNKWGAYQSELTDFEWTRQDNEGETRSANAVVMDWADDVTYATHDIADYFRARLIPLHNLTLDRSRIIAHGVDRLGSRAKFDHSLFEQEIDIIIKEFENSIKSPDWDTDENRAAINRITSDNITSCVKATRYSDIKPFVSVDPRSQYRVEALKELTWFYVIHRPSLAMSQEGQKRIIGTPHDQLVEFLRKSPTCDRIPTQLRNVYAGLSTDGDKKGRRARAVADYICMLTEAQAVDLGERLSGRSRNSMFGTWFA